MYGACTQLTSSAWLVKTVTNKLVLGSGCDSYGSEGGNAPICEDQEEEEEEEDCQQLREDKLFDKCNKKVHMSGILRTYYFCNRVSSNMLSNLVQMKNCQNDFYYKLEGKKPQ